MDPNAVSAMLKMAPELAKEVYGDVVKETLQEASKIGVDAVKAIRLALFPIQFAAALQDRLAGYIDKAIRKTPEELRISPIESVFLPVAEKLKYQEEDNPITKLYINLMSRAMNRERVGEAHPAFITIISQMAPDEVVFMKELAGRDYTMIIRTTSGKHFLLNPDRDELFDRSKMPGGMKQLSKKVIFQYEKLAQPELFHVFLEHLNQLGITTYDNEPSNTGEFRGKAGLPHPGQEFQFWFIRLSNFGKLFFKACASD